MLRWIVLVAACGTPEPASERPRPAAVTGDGGITIPATGELALPLAWTVCHADADCAMVTLGCCDETAVRRERAIELRAMLERSGRPYCAPKTACGPNKNGTWDDEPAVCRGGLCRKPGGL